MKSSGKYSGVRYFQISVSIVCGNLSQMYGCSCRYVAAKKSSFTKDKLGISKMRLIQRLFLVSFHVKHWCREWNYLTTHFHPLRLFYSDIFVHLICDKINSFVTSLLVSKAKKWMQITYNSTLAILRYLGRDGSYKEHASWHLHAKMISYGLYFPLLMTALITFFNNKHSYKPLVLTKIS